MRSSTPPPELISSMASSVALSWDCSIAEVTPVWENNTPTRHGPSLFSLKLMTLTWTIALVRFERPYVRLAETQIASPAVPACSPRFQIDGGVFQPPKVLSLGLTLAIRSRCASTISLELHFFDRTAQQAHSSRTG